MTNRELFEKGAQSKTTLIERKALVKFGENYIELALKELEKLENFTKEEI